MYERRHSLEISAYGGVATPAPGLSAVFLITTLASDGLPALNNFVGEYLVLQGAAQVNFRWAIYAAIGVILSACYMLWLYQRAFFGEASEAVKSRVNDLNLREWAAILPLLVLMVWMGTATQTFLPPISAANARILRQTQQNVDFHVRKNESSDEVAQPLRLPRRDSSRRLRVAELHEPAGVPAQRAEARATMPAAIAGEAHAR